MHILQLKMQYEYVGNGKNIMCENISFEDCATKSGEEKDKMK